MEISIAQFNQNLLIFLVLSIKSDLVNWPMNFIILDYIFLKVNSGTYQMTCLPRLESSEASVKGTCLFHSRVGSSILTLLTLMRWDVQRSGDK